MLAQNHQRQPSAAQASMRSRSGTAASSKSRPRPISRGSTTSDHSVGPATFNQHHPEQIVEHQSGLYMAHTDPSEQRIFQHGPEEMLLQYGQQIAQTQQQYNIDPTLPEGHHNGMRPASQHGYSDHNMHQFPVMQGYPQGMPQYGIPQEPINAQSRNLEGMENQSPAPDDSENAEPGAKKKKGAATSMANDAELRRLLQQYQGRSLKEVATEVQRKEGGEGKSEKAKQVFAMLWLQENCRRSSNSVRRDRVFSRYTERCGNERVPTLNPASFGKLVRIIFPNVQTRRLGVRGESKYHYVDLSLFPEDEDRQHQQYQQYQMATMATADSMHDVHNSVQIPGGVQQSHVRSMSMPQPILPQPPTDSADFPLPSKIYGPRPTSYDEDAIANEPTAALTKPPEKMDCHYLNAPTIRVRTSNMQIQLLSALPAVRSSLPGTVSSYLGLPSSTTHTTFSPPNSQTDSPIDLPDIHAYLANTTYDRDIATSLSHLYRSYCIIVIDSFRYCREKNFFHHHSAFNGTMTVPISKLLANERLAPWIQECDMRMYKKMIRYIAPLVTQVVPDQVWNMFDHVSKKLVPHLVSAFEEKCPTHVLVAKIVPAARFCHLLKKLKAANTAANHAATMLVDERKRTQMWVDLLTCVDPERVIEDSMPPPECWSAVEGIISHDLKALIAPADEEFVRGVEQDPSSPFPEFMAATAGAGGLLGSKSGNEEIALSALDGWIQWLEKLPLAFPKHQPQCLINWHNGLWKSIMTQLGVGGASTYQVWWYLEAFLNNMLGWLAQMEGLLMDETQQRDLEERELSKRREDDELEMAERSFQMDGDSGSNGKRKRGHKDAGDEERSASRASHSSQSSHGRETESRPQTAMTSNTGLDGAADDHDIDELGNGAPLDLPSIDTSPQKRQHQAHDDSGISLDVDIEGEVSGGEDQLKRLKKEWGIMSDPADADGHVIVV